MTELISILVPIYGVEKYIERCSRSLFGQTYFNIEYIFVDDCTKDNSIGILKKVLMDYPLRAKKVKIVSHSTNRGLSAARNTALTHAEGAYIMHVDSDDYLSECAVETAYKKIICCNADVLVFGINLIFENKIVRLHQYDEGTKEDYVKKLIARKSLSCVWNKMYKRDVLFKGIRSIEGINMGEDYALSPRLMYNASKIIYLDEPLYNYVQYNSMAYTKVFTEKSLYSLIQAEKTVRDFFENLNDAILYKDALVCGRLNLAIDLLKSICLYTPKQQRAHFLNKVVTTFNLKENGFSAFSLNKYMVLFAQKRMYVLLYMLVSLGYMVKKWMKH